MIRKWQKKVLCGGLLASMLLIGGCGEMHDDYSFNPDGTITSHSVVKVSDSILQTYPDALDAVKQMEKKDKDDGSEIRELSNGYSATKVYQGIKELVNTQGEVWNPDEDYDGVRCRQGWLYDYYTLDLYLKKQAAPDLHMNYQPDIPSYFSMNNKTNSGMAYYEKSKKARQDANDINQMANNAIQTGLDAAKADVSFHLPYAADQSNADSKVDGGKTLSWDIKPLALGKSDLNMQAAFRIYHEKRIIFMAVVSVILLIGAIVFLTMGVMRREDIQKRNKLMGLSAVLFLIIAVEGVYAWQAVANPPKLTVADRIIADGAVDSEGKPLADTLKKEEKAKENPLDEVRGILQKKEIQGSLLAASVVDESGFLAFVKDNDDEVFIVYDAKDDKIAKIHYPTQKAIDRSPYKSFLRFRANPTKLKTGELNYRPAIFNLELPNDSKDSKDKWLGIWNKTTHIVPIFALFKVDDQDKVVPGRLTSACYNLSPERYQVPLNEVRL